MPFRFYRRKKILPGVSVNLSRSGLSVSLGPSGAKVTIGPKGVRKTVGIPGTGISYSEQSGGKSAGGAGCLMPILAVIAIVVCWLA